MNLLYGLLAVMVIVLGVVVATEYGQGYTDRDGYVDRKHLPITIHREETLFDENYNISRNQRPLGMGFGKAPCVRCQRDTGNCYWVYPGQKAPEYK